MGTPPTIDGAFARWLVARAGQALLGLRAELGFADPGALKSAGDKVSHDLIRTELARWRPGDAVLSEEDEGSRLAWAAEVSPEGVSRRTADRVWIVDPLDGTREF
ncbi:inositol monophosphatase family protein, partial [Micromonospora azadirachtae]